MLKLIQTKLHNPPRQTGNCFATVIACFLGLEINEVPAFEKMFPSKDDPPEANKVWMKAASDFMYSHGFEWGSLDGHTQGFYCVIGNTSRSKNVKHICIYKDGRLWHDPHPDQTGLTSETHFEYIEKIN